MISKARSRGIFDRWLAAVAAIAMLSLGAGAVLAQSTPPYPTDPIALRWNDCFGDGGAYARNFACNTNTASEVLVVSAFPPAAMPQLNGAAVVLDLLTPSGNIPSWWQFQSGGCRGTNALAFFDPPPTATNCIDPWMGQAAGGTNMTYPADGGPGYARLRTVQAIPGSSSVPAGSEVFVCRVVIVHQKTVGTGSCSGCATGLCIGLNSVQLTQPAGVGDTYMIVPVAGTNSDYVAWQGDLAMTSSFYVYHGVAWRKDFTGCVSATEAKRPTWGTIKKLYR